MAKELHQITFDFADSNDSKKVEPEVKTEPVEATQLKNSRGRKSLKEAEERPDLIEVPEDEILFQKQYYSIGEVAEMFRVNTSLLRYWESEFGLDLRKNRKGDRFFMPKDVKSILLIHDLLRRRKFTIEGAKEYLKKDKLANEKHELIDSLSRLRSFLLELKAHL